MMRTIIALVLLCCVNAGLYVTNSDLKKDQAKAQKNLQRAQSRLKKAKDHSPLVIDQKLSRIESGQRVKDLSLAHHLQDVTFKFLPEQELNADLALTRSEFRIQSSTDETVYTFIESLDQSLPGLIFPQQLTIWQPSEGEIRAIYAIDWVTLK